MTNNNEPRKKPIYVRGRTHARIKALAEDKGYTLWKWVDKALSKALDVEEATAK